MTGDPSQRGWGEQWRLLELLKSNLKGRFRWRNIPWPALCLLSLLSANPAFTAPSLVLPSFILEGEGVRTNAGNFRLGVTATSNVVVSLSSTDPTLVFVPDLVTVTNGQTNVTFNLTVGDNPVVANSQQVTITASAPGFGAVSNTFEVWENDAHRIRFSAVDWVQTTNTGIGILLNAEDASGNRLTNFYGGAMLSAMGLEGVLPLDTTNTGGFADGQRYLTVTVLSPGTAVRLFTTPFLGESDAFNVVPAIFRAIGQNAADIAWHAASQTLLASVPATGGIYSNRLVAIDPATELVTNSYPVSLDPGQMELSPDGNYLYVAITNRRALQRFDMNTRLAGLKFVLDTNTNPVRVAYDLAVPAGLSDTVVVAAREEDQIGNISAAQIWRYNSGVPVALPAFNAAGGWELERLNTAAEVLLSPTLVRGQVSTGNLLASAPFFPATTAMFRDGQIYDDKGDVYHAGTLAMLGTFPGVIVDFRESALVEVAPDLRRVLFLVGYANFGTTFYKLKVYDRDLRQLLHSFDVPGTPADPTRFLRYGTNGLAYVTGNGQIWFVRTEAILPNRPAADLSLALSGMPPTAVLGADYPVTITLSNAGPGVASLVRVTNTLPANVALVQTSASTGSVVAASSAFTWNVGPLPAGSNATLAMTVRFGNAGWQTNLTCALGFEGDPNPANNVTTLPLYVELAPHSLGVFPVNAASEDLLYDPARDRLLLSVGSGTSGQSNGITVFDPYRGVVDSFTPLTLRPSKLVRSDDGQFLYVSLPADALVRRLTLNNLAQNLEFALGGEDIFGTWYPFYAADMATVPGNPNALVTWRVRRAGPMADEYGQSIAWFDNGVMRPNVTSPGGNWRVEFDTDAGTLFGYNSGDLRRCSVDATGVSFMEAFPQFYSAGDDVEYGAGQLFGTAGRVVEYQPFRVAWVVAGAQTATLVEPDPAANRLYFLIQTNGWQIQVQELGTLRWLGSIPVPNVIGTPTSLIRWGTNGLAFRTSSNQLYVIRSPLTQPEASAAVVAQLTGPTTPVQPGEDVLLTLTLTNQGLATSLDLQITNQFSPSVSILAVTANTGSWSTNAGQVTWSVPVLNAGASAILTSTVRPSSTGVVTVVASAVTPTPDPVLGDNTAAFSLLVGQTSAQENLAMLRIAVNDLAWSPSLGRLLASASNSTPSWSGGLISIEPFTRAVRFETTLGGDAGRLTISTDDTRLHAGVDLGLNTLTLPDLVFTNRYLINANDARYRVHDMDAIPGANGSVFVGGRRLTDNTTRLGVYDFGLVRTNELSFFTTGFSLEFGTDPALCYYQDHAAGGFRRYAIQTNGLTLLDTDTTLLPGSTAHTLAWADGHIFSSVGILVDPFSRTRVGSALAITNNSAICYDAAAGRAYYVSTLGSTAYLHAIDKATLVATGSRVISGITGLAASLVRWGTNGLAFRTTMGRLAILQTELVPSAPPTDLALEMDALQPLGIVGSNFVYAITVTNAGPNAAPNSQVLFRISTNATVTAASTSVGTLVTNSTQLVANLGMLAVGGQASVTVTIVPAQPGSLLAVASVTSGALEPNRTNNTQALTNAAALLLAPGATTILSQTANDLAYNPTNGRLYVSGAAGGISVINPALALVEANWPMPSAPTRLALSDNAQRLYAVFDAGRRVGCFTTASGAFDFDFSLGTNVSTPFVLVDFAPVAGSVQSLAVSKQAAGIRWVQILDDGALRPGVQLSTAVNHLEFGNNTNLLYATSLRQFVIGNTNLVEQGSAIPGIGSENFEFAADHFYTTGGKRIEAASRVILGTYAGLGTGTLVEPDIANDRVFFLTRVGSTWQVRAYEPATFALLGSTTVNNVLGNPTNFVRWGADGLAFCTSSSQVFLMRSLLAPSGPAADLAVTQTSSAGPFFVGSNLTFTLTITNSGSSPATNVVLLSRFPTNTLVVGLTNSQGTSTQAIGLVTCLLGTLTNGATAEVKLTFRPLRAGNFSNLGVVTSAASDPAIGNNSATLSVPVQFNLGPDSFGVVDLPTADLAYDAVSGLLYATPTNQPGEFAGSVLTIDPATGLIGIPLSVGPDLSQLTISDDGSRLTVLADRGREFRRIQLPSGFMELRVPFSAATGQSGSVADEIKSVPQQPEALAVVLQFPGVLGGGSPSLVVYDNATPRPALAIWQNTFEFFSTNLVIGLYWNSVPQPTARIELTSTGFVQRASAGNLLDGTVLSSGGGLIYSSGGSAFDPMTLTKVRSFGVSGPAAPDPAVNRVAFCIGSGAGTRLRVFDTLGLLERGSLAITNAQGTPAKLLRCGADRFAFRTSAGQIIIVRSSGIPTGPAADLALGLLNSTPTPSVQQPFALTLLVTNLGPGTASAVTVSNAIPALMSLVSANPSQGLMSGASPAILWHVGELAAGAVATNQLLLLPQAGGALAAQSLVFGNASDSNGVNDVTSTTWLVDIAPTTALSTLALSAGDLAWEPISQRLVMSVTTPTPAVSNSLLRLDPVTGQFHAPIPIGSGPGKLAITDDGQFAYLGLDPSRTLLKVNLATSEVLTNNSLWGRLLEIELPPSNPNLVATLQEDNLDAYLNGAELPLTGSLPWDGPSSLTRPNAAGRFYGYVGFRPLAFFTPTFYRMTVNNSGWVINDTFEGLISGAETTIESANGLVFASSGTVLQPETLSVVTNLPDLAPNSLVRPDGTSGLLTFLTPKEGQQWWLRQYSHANYDLVREFRVPRVLGSPRSLVRWGADGVAFLTTSNQLYLLRPPLAYADLVVLHQTWPAQVIAGQSFQVVLSVTNRGPSFSADAFVTNTPPAFATMLAASASQGTVTITNNRAVFALGNLPTNHVVTLTVTLLPTNSAQVTLTNSALATQAFTEVQPADNSHTISIPALADRDLDGIPDVWETAYGLNPTNAVDGPLDSDCDGLTNLQEYQAGSHPLRFEAVRLHSAQLAGPGLFEARIIAAVGNTYTLESTTNLVNWIPLDVFVCREPNQIVRVSVPPSATRYFFRLRSDTNTPLPLLTLINVPSPPTNWPQIRVNAAPGRFYSLQVSSNLTQWTTISNYFGAECATVITDTEINRTGARFYRLLLP